MFWGINLKNILSFNFFLNSDYVLALKIVTNLHIYFTFIVKQIDKF